MKTSEYHEPVLLQEAMELLSVHPGGVYIDATLGGGGYSEGMLEAGAQVYGFDTDPAAQEFASKRLAKFGNRFIVVPENFAKLSSSLPLLFKEGAGGWFDGIVYDLGVSSHQFDTASVGLSYRVDAPLDMRLDPRLAVSARDVIADYTEEELRNIFRTYGEEPFSARIARSITRARDIASIDTTSQLARIVVEGIREDKKNETLSRIFQAIRIEVNHELDNLRASLDQAVTLLNGGGRIVVVSYHSLEDRIAKEFFRSESAPEFAEGAAGALKSRIDRARARLRLLTKKPVRPSSVEIERNPRARSAKLRAAERIGN